MFIGQSGEHVVAAPGYDPDLQDERSYYGDLSGYYGYQPYWGWDTSIRATPTTLQSPPVAATHSSPAADFQSAWLVWIAIHCGQVDPRSQQ